MLTHVDRVLAVIAAMLLFTWHELVLFHDRPTTPDPSRGQVIAASTRVFGDSDPFYLTQLDVALRWGLGALVLAGDLGRGGHVPAHRAVGRLARPGLWKTEF